MDFSFLKRKFSPALDAEVSIVHRLAEQIIRDVNSLGLRSFRIRAYDKSEVFKHNDLAFLEIEEDTDLSVQTRNREMVVGLTTSSDNKGMPMMCIPAGLLLPLINTFAVQTREKNNRHCFTVGGGKSDKNRYFEVKVILEGDSTLSIEFDEIS